MGSFCSSERSVKQAINEESRPLRRSSLIGEEHISPDDEEDPEIRRRRKARDDWIRVIANGYQPDMLLFETVAEQYDDLNVVETVFDDGDRAIHKAIRAKNLELLYSLLTVCGANINAPQAQDGDTPLMVAASVGEVRLVQLLLGRLDDYPIDSLGEVVAEQNYKNGKGETAADIAIRSPNKALWALLSPDKLAELLVDNPHVLSDRDLTPDDGPPSSNYSSLTTSAGERDTRSIYSTAPDSPDSMPPDIFDDPPDTFMPPQFVPNQAPEGVLKLSNNRRDDSTTPRSLSGGISPIRTPGRPAPPRRSSSVNVINGIPEDQAPVLESKGGWLKKRKPDWLGSWQDRYLLVKGDYIGWAEKEVDVDDPGHPLERRKFNSYEHLNKVDRVEPVESSSNCKFKVLVSNSAKSNAPREYEFKAPTTEDRDDWVRLIKRAVKRVRRANAGGGGSFGISPRRS